MAKKQRKQQVDAARKTGSTKDQTRGQNEHDPKGRTGHYTAAGDAPLMKK
jgi:hypothetical protein